ARRARAPRRCPRARRARAARRRSPPRRAAARRKARAPARAAARARARTRAARPSCPQARGPRSGRPHRCSPRRAAAPAAPTCGEPGAWELGVLTWVESLHGGASEFDVVAKLGSLADGEVRELEIDLARLRGGTLRGLVLADGAPLAGTRVTLWGDTVHNLV